MNIKNHFSALCLVLSSVFFIASCNFKGDSTIYSPIVETNETNEILEIAKIEFADTATVFYFDAYHCTDKDCWFRIAEKAELRGSNRTYNVIGSEGIELGKKMQVPESGHLSFALYFEPVDKSEKVLDFVEGDKNGEWRITGIKLYEVPQPKKAIKCTLKGEVIDRPYSSRLMLSKEGEDMRVVQWISIPIRDGKFEYALNCDYEELYQLTFYDEYGRSWMPIPFISEQGVINFTLHPQDQFKMNIIEGGKLNKEYRDFDIEFTKMIEPLFDAVNAKNEQLYNEGKYYTAEAQLLLDQARASTDEKEKDVLWQQWYKMQDQNLHLTPEAKEVQKSSDSVGMVIQQYHLQYAKEHPNIVGYSILLSITKRAFRGKGEISQTADIHQTIFAPKFPDHPYTKKMEDLLTGSSFKAGAPFIDFTTGDMTGKPVKLSDRIAGKPTVLHLWASWCGPCRKHGKELIPVYEEFRDKGFVVIGVAREKDTPTAAEAAIKKDGYPWENLVELNDAEQIWNKYGVGNAGGAVFLIDEKGIIVAVSPTIDEIRDFLSNKL